MKTAADLRADPRVKAIDHDEDGWWIWLRPEWADVKFDPWQPCFLIHEDTWKQAVARMRDVRKVTA